MYVKSSPLQQNVVTEAWTADFLVLGQVLYHWAILPSMFISGLVNVDKNSHFFLNVDKLSITNWHNQESFFTIEYFTKLNTQSLTDV